MSAGFDHVIVVDWSAAAKPSPARPSADAIWIGHADASGTRPHYHRTRAAAEAALKEMLGDLSGRILVGFDFALGYPHGFAQLLTGQTGAAAVWQWMAQHIVDGPDNRNNRFALANQINAGFTAAGPFWGRPERLAMPHLPGKKTVDYAGLGIAEKRRVETKVPRAQPVWKLFTTGSVGSQVLMGLPMIARLAANGAQVWPFEAADSRIVLAEIYPSLIDAAVNRAMQSGEIKDAAQTRLLALALWRLSHSGDLARLLDDVPPDVRRDEGWILGAGHVDALRAVLE